MKTLFIHGSEKLKEDNDGNFYTDGSYNQEVWDRYLSIFKDISVIFRKDPCIYDTDFARKNFIYFDKDRLNFIELPNLMTYTSFFSFNKRKLFKKIIKKAVIDHEYIIARLPSTSGYTAVKYAKKFNKPYLIEVVGCPWDALWNHSIQGKILAPINYFKMKKSVKYAPYALYVTNEFLQKRYPSKGKTIGCSDVALPPLDENILTKRLDKIEKMAPDKPIILGTTAAVNVRYKGQQYVIKAISKLNSLGYNFEYHLAGGGDNSYLKKVAKKYKVADRIKFLGSLTHEKVFEFLDDIDIYIQPSLTEGMPRALIEAMSRGCPVLGSKTGGIPELLNKNFIFKNGSVKGICELLKHFNKETMKAESIRSFEKAKEFDKDLLNNRRNELLSEFMDSNYIE